MQNFIWKITFQERFTIFIRLIYVHKTTESGRYAYACNPLSLSLSFSLSFVDFFSKIAEFRVKTVMIVLFMCKTTVCNFYHIRCNFCNKRNNVTILHTFFKKHLIETSVGMELFWATLKVAHLTLFQTKSILK